LGKYRKREFHHGKNLLKKIMALQKYWLISIFEAHIGLSGQSLTSLILKAGKFGGIIRASLFFILSILFFASFFLAGL